jgi:hypothetical protein
MASEIKATFPDLRELQRDLESVELGLGHLVAEVAAEQLGQIIAEVQALLPFDPEHRGWRGKHKRPDPGHIRDSVKGAVSGNSLIVRSTHPGGPVHWWSGTIAPRGTELTIERRPGAGPDFVSSKEAQVGRDLQQAYDRLAREHGL